MMRDRSIGIANSVLAILSVVIGHLLGMPWWVVVTWIGVVLVYDLIFHDPNA